jgi:hypoxanthine phosphoribosyltransferase
MGETLRTLYTREQVAATVKRLADEITADYAGRRPLVIGILKGSFIFMADLVRQLNFPLEIDFVRVSSYGRKDVSSGRVHVVQGIRAPVRGRDVLVVEDIIDTGLSLRFVLDAVRARKPASIKVCCLLDKPARRTTPVPVNYLGFTVPDRFLVGYGLDWGERYRNLPDVCYLEDPEP